MAGSRSSLRLVGLGARLIGGAMLAGLVACGSDSAVSPGGTATAATGGTSGARVSTSATAVPATPVTPVASAAAGVTASRLVLVEGDSLVVRETDGTRRTIVQIDPGEGFPTNPAWSPDGASVAFVRRTTYSGDAEADWGDDLVVVAAEGGEPRLVRARALKGELIVGVAWAADSERVLVGRLQIGFKDGVPARTDATAIVEIDTTGGSERVVIEGGYEPSVSADGGRMAYLRHEEVGFPTVMVANGDGTGAMPLAGVESFEQVRSPRISPDGRLVAFAAAAPAPTSMRAGGRGGLGAVVGWLAALVARKAEAHGVPMDVWVADVATGEVRQLTFLGEDDPYLGWSADGERVVFIATFGLYEVSVADGAVVRVDEGRFDGQVAVGPE